MKFTGERVVPGQVEPDLLNEHLARYHFAGQFVAGRRVLDAACGSGYGAALLARAAQSVAAVDISPEAIAYARSHYAAPQVEFCEGDCLALPLADASIDVAVAFEIVEHLHDAAGFLRELRRVLAPAGLLVLSTPNRLYYTEDRGAVNPFHAREYSYAEMGALIAPVFPHHHILFENHIDGFSISGPGAEIAADLHPPASVLAGAEGLPALAERGRDAYFFIALCSAQPLPPARPLLFVPSTGNVLRERESHIHQLELQLAGALEDRDRARAMFQQMENELNEFRNFFQQREKELDQMLAARTAWAQSLEQDTAQARAAFEKLQEEFSELRQEFDERTAWALKLNEERTQLNEVRIQLAAELDTRTAWALRLDAELKQAVADLQQIYGSLWYRAGKKLRLSPVPPSNQSTP